MDTLEKTLRKFSIAKLEALDAIAGYEQSVVSTTTISGMLTKVDQELGGIISSLSRTQIEGNPLILPAGKSPAEGILWKINEEVAPKDTIEKLVSAILEENKEYRMALDNKE